MRFKLSLKTIEHQSQVTIGRYLGKNNPFYGKTHTQGV